MKRVLCLKRSFVGRMNVGGNRLSSGRSCFGPGRRNVLAKRVPSKGRERGNPEIDRRYFRFTLLVSKAPVKDPLMCRRAPIQVELQVRILRLIQEHEIEKVGATSSIKLDVRIIAATHRDLGAMAKAGAFREDLYYRLMVVPIKIPALRERAEDIPELVEHFLIKFRHKHGREDLTLTQEVLRQLCRYDWPGNIRQLENAVERIVLLTKRVGNTAPGPSRLSASPASAFLRTARRSAGGRRGS